MSNVSNEQQIRTIIESWAKAVRNADINAILANHSKDIVMYDVPEPFQSVGIEAYRKTWDTFFAGTRLGVFDIDKMDIIAGEQVAFCFGTMKCSNKEKNGQFEDLRFRLTVGLKKINDRWTIIHEHHSIPAL